MMFLENLPLVKRGDAPEKNQTTGGLVSIEYSRSAMFYGIPGRFTPWNCMRECGER